MSEPIKYSIRGLGGFFVIIIFIVLAAMGFLLGVIGVIIVIFSWFPIFDPEFLVTYRITFLNERITDPNFAFILFFITGLTLIAVSLIFFGFTYYFFRFAQLMDQDMTETVDMSFPSVRKIIFSRKHRGIIVLLILLFGTIMLFLQLLFII